MHPIPKTVESVAERLDLTFWLVKAAATLCGAEAGYAKQIVGALSRQLGWTHFVLLLPVKDTTRTHPVLGQGHEQAELLQLGRSGTAKRIAVSRFTRTAGSRSLSTIF